MESNPTRMCELLVGLPAVTVLGIDDVEDGPIRVHLERSESRTGCPACGVVNDVGTVAHEWAVCLMWARWRENLLAVAAPGWSGIKGWQRDGWHLRKLGHEMSECAAN